MCAERKPFICPNRQLSVPREPTACEATHYSLVRYFRDDQQTLRHLTLLSSVFEFKVLPHGMVASIFEQSVCAEQSSFAIVPVFRFQ